MEGGQQFSFLFISKGVLKMRFDITFKHMNPSDALSERTKKKLSKLDKYFDQETVAHVNMSVEKNRHMMEVTIWFDSTILRAQEATDDMYTTIDRIQKKLEKQIMRHKSKLEKRLKTGAFLGEAPDFGYEEEEQPRIVRTKRFPIKPLSEEEALLQLQLLDHSFFVFINADTSDVNVLYRRYDGNFGLIEPEY